MQKYWPKYFKKCKYKKYYCQSLSHSVTENISELNVSFKETTYEDNEDAPAKKIRKDNNVNSEKVLK